MGGAPVRVALAHGSDLRELQQLVYAGGESTSRAVSHTAATGAKNVSRTEELILLEGKGATRSARGGFAQNSSSMKKSDRWYKKEPGYPDLTLRKADGAGPGQVTFPNIATYSGQIVNRELDPGERIFRVFGPGGTTHGFPVTPSSVAGSTKHPGPAFWGLGEAPTNARSWRQGSAVLDEWNHDGFIVIGEILPGHSVPACTGVIAEQVGTDIGVQYLKGGDKQAMLDLAGDVRGQLTDMAATVVDTKVPMKKEIGGIAWEIRPTGWKDANEIHGYLHMPGPGTVQTVRMGASELASKRNQSRSH